MSMEDTLEYDNNRGAISGSATVSFYFNDYEKKVEVSFTNIGGTLKIIDATLNDKSFFDFTDDNDWLSYEDEIQNRIDSLEAEKENDHPGYGYNGSAIR